MRKRLISSNVSNSPETPPAEKANWLDLEALAQVEITSEDATHPIESALGAPAGSGWQAAAAGEQTIRLLFDDPLGLRRIRLLFSEERKERTQQFVVRWSADRGRSYQEIVRQQYHFSPPDTTREQEDYTVALDGVTALEISIIPEIAGGDARATITRLQLA
jgi:hypothetical protein